MLQLFAPEGMLARHVADLELPVDRPGRCGI